MFCSSLIYYMPLIKGQVKSDEFEKTFLDTMDPFPWNFGNYVFMLTQQKRSYYMAVLSYKFLFKCWKNISVVTATNKWRPLQHEKRNFVPPCCHVVFYLLFISIVKNYNFYWEMHNLLWVTIVTVIFSCVKMSSR